GNNRACSWGNQASPDPGGADLPPLGIDIRLIGADLELRVASAAGPASDIDRSRPQFGIVRAAHAIDADSPFRVQMAVVDDTPAAQRHIPFDAAGNLGAGPAPHAQLAGHHDVFQRALAVLDIQLATAVIQITVEHH